MDKKSLSHTAWKCQVSKANLYHYSFHPQIQEKTAIWSSKNRCAGNNSNTVQV